MPDPLTAQYREHAIATAMRSGMRKPHVGPLLSAVAGRTDHLPIDVMAGSYVLPADVVSGLGEGNTISGMQVIHHMFGSNQTPYGGRMQFAKGGAAEQPGENVPIVAAGGEVVLSPDQVRQIGGGDLDRGHAILDAFVKHTRRKTIKTLKKLPGPAKK